MAKKRYILFEKKNIDSAYRLIQKIIKTKILTDKDACHLAVIFADNHCYKANESYLGDKFSHLLDYISKIYPKSNRRVKSIKSKSLGEYDLRDLLVKLAFKKSMPKEEFFAFAEQNGIFKKEADQLLETLRKYGDIYFPKKGIIERF